MKRCPKCLTTYTDDSLAFCLQDGAALIVHADPRTHSETLEMRIDPTVATVSEIETVAAARPVPAQRIEQEGVDNRAAPPQSVGGNKLLIAGVFAIALLLLALVGIGAAIFIRDYLQTPGQAHTPLRTEDVNANVNANATRRVDQPQPEATAVPARPLKITAFASSVRAPYDELTYDAANLVDENTATAWIEGDAGPGIGAWVRCDFDREVALRQVIIYPGYFKSAKVWETNNRVAAMTLSFSDGSSRKLHFQDERIPATVDLAGVRTRTVKLVIDEVYPASKDVDDTAISEVKFVWEP